MAQGGGEFPFSGLTLLQTGPEEGLLEHAARHCFWRLNKEALQKLARSLGLQDPPADLGQLIQALIEEILGKLPEKEVQRILALRGQGHVDPIPGI
eukprot:5187793-Lingulodinium_polyedra.AAC.1